MPIDPSIIGGLRPQLPSPLEIVGQVAQIQGLREQTAARRLAGEEARQKGADRAAIRRVLTETNGDVELALPRLRTISPKAALEFETEIEQARNQKFQAATHEMNARIKGLEFVGTLAGMAHDDATARTVNERLRNFSPEIAQLLPDLTAPYDPARWGQLTDLALSAKDRYEKSQTHLKLFGEGKQTEALGGALSLARNAEEWDANIQTFRDLGGPKAIADLFGPRSPDAPQRAAQLAITPKDRATLTGQAEGRAQTAAHQAVLEGQGAERLAIARRRAAQSGGTSATDREDVTAIADAIVNGDQPPSLTGLYRYAAPVRAELARRGYDLSTAGLDWRAAERHIATLNNPQQTRLRQAVDTAIHSLDLIDDLATQWKGTNLPVLNRLNLLAAKNGVYGKENATIATQLEAQIADLTSEIANAYMGGNSPTDHALQLAAKNLSADWSEKVLKDMTNLARKNLQIRQNAIRNVGVIGASPQSPYVPAPPTPPDPRIGTQVTYQGKPYKVIGVTPAGKLQLQPVP